MVRRPLGQSGMKFGIGFQGVLHLPLLLAVFIISVSGFRIWGFLRNWRFLAETQLRLDRCVGEVAQEFRDSLNSIEKSNARIKKLRIAIQLAELEPALIPPLQAVLVIQVGQQEFVRAKWVLRRARWSLDRGCGKAKDTAHLLPVLSFIRDPPDWIGPQALHWTGEGGDSVSGGVGTMPEEFNFQVSHRSRHAAAKVKGGMLGEEISIDLGTPESQAKRGDSGGLGRSGKNKWKATWSEPRKLGWASFP